MIRRLRRRGHPGQFFAPTDRLYAGFVCRPMAPGVIAAGEIGDFLGQSVIKRLSVRILALHVGTWHVHLVIDYTTHPIGEVVKCAKDAVRYGLSPGRPIWTDGCDKRCCFDVRSVLNAHPLRRTPQRKYGWPAKPWSFISEYRGPTK